ncbi:MAG: hypothetical protein IPM29_31775 [Planctomycetes bacterium]|nr:hypothetical protein [Planctomycetota bacterium]
MDRAPAGPAPPTPARRARLAGAALVAVAMLVVSYALALGRRELPRGHPWVGIAMLCMAGWFAVQLRLHRNERWTRAAVAILPLAAVACAAVGFYAT